MARANFSNYFKSGQSAYDWSDDDWGDFGDKSWEPTTVVNVNGQQVNADGSPRTDVQQNQIDNPQAGTDIQSNVKNLIGVDVNTPKTVDEKMNPLVQAIQKEREAKNLAENNQTIDNMIMSDGDSTAQFNELNKTAVMGDSKGMHGAPTPDGSDPNDPDFMKNQSKKAKWGYGQGQWAPGKLVGGAVLGGLGMVGKAMDKLTDWNQDGERFGTATPGIEGVQGGQGVQDIVGGIQNRIDNPQSKADVAANAPTTLPDGSKAANPDPDTSFGGSATDWAKQWGDNFQFSQTNLGNTSGNIGDRGIRRAAQPDYKIDKVDVQEEKKEGVLSKAWKKFKQGRQDKKVAKWQADGNKLENYDNFRDSDVNEPNEQQNLRENTDTTSWQDSYDPSITPITPPVSEEDPNLPQDTVDDPAAHLSQGKISREDYQRQIEQRDEIKTPISDAYNKSSNTVKRLQGLTPPPAGQKVHTKQSMKSLGDWVSVYSPASDDNNPEKITSDMLQMTGYSADTNFWDMDSSKIADAQAKLEGGTGVKRNQQGELWHNPGNLKFAGQPGAHEDPNTGFAVFDSAESGRAAHIKQIEKDQGRARDNSGADNSQNSGIFLKPVEQAWSNTMFKENK